MTPTRITHQPHSERAKNRGLGLLETIAALTIMAAAAAVLFPWVSQSLRSLERNRTAENRAIATLQSVRWLDGLDPRLTPDGIQTFANFRVRWRMLATHNEPTPVTNSGGQFRSFSTMLFKGTVWVERTDGEPWFEFEHSVVSTMRRQQSERPF